MTGDAVGLITKVLREHTGPEFIEGAGVIVCLCGFDCLIGAWTGEDCATKNWADHVAAEVDAALVSRSPDVLSGHPRRRRDA